DRGGERVGHRVVTLQGGGGIGPLPGVCPDRLPGERSSAPLSGRAGVATPPQTAPRSRMRPPTGASSAFARVGARMPDRFRAASQSRYWTGLLAPAGTLAAAVAA